MSVIKVDNYNIASILKDNNLLSDDYSEKQLIQDLSMLFYQPWIYGERDEEDIKSYFNKIQSLITDNTKIENRSDLLALTLSDRKDVETNLSELDERVKTYKDYNPDIYLPSIGSIANDPNIMVAKIEYFRKLSIPFIDSTNVVLKELFNEFKSNLYFGRFHELLIDYVKDNNDNNYINAITNVEEDKMSKFYATIQAYTYSNHGCFAEITKSIKDMIKASLENPNTDLSELVQVIKLQNNFIDEASLYDASNLSKSRYDEDYRSTGRR